MEDIPRYERDIKFQQPLDLAEFRANAIKRLGAELPKATERLEQMRKDVAEVQSNYSGDSKPWERVVASALGPLERDVREIAEELKKYQDLQGSVKG